MDRRTGDQNLEDLNNTIYHHDIVDMYQTLHPTKEKCMFFLSAYGLLTKTDHILSHTANKINLKELMSDRVCFLTTVELT